MNRTAEEPRRAPFYRSVYHRLAGMMLLASGLTLGAMGCPPPADEKGGGNEVDDDDDSPKRDGGVTVRRDGGVDLDDPTGSRGVCENRKVSKQRITDAGATRTTDAGTATPRATDAGAARPATPPATPAAPPTATPAAPPTEPPAAGNGENSKSLYFNDFESPSMPLKVQCANSLDQSGINTLYGTPEFTFSQRNTVEGVLIADKEMRYSDPSGKGGKYAIGMFSEQQDDLLALSFTMTKPYLNIGFEMSAIDINGCGGPLGAAEPRMQISLYETPKAGFDLGSGSLGTLLQRTTVRGRKSRDAWTFDWVYNKVVLDAQRAAADAATGNRRVTIVFDATHGGYVAFDNLSIVQSETPGVVDSDGNGVTDDKQCEDE